MPNKTQEHPQKEQLIAFGLGKLGPAAASAVEQHLEACDTCCETLLGMKDDTFCGLVREATPPESAWRRTETRSLAPGVEPSRLDATLDIELSIAAEPAVEGELPTELREHPRYEVQERIGRGGMGDVYKAQHRVMNRPVALKVIKPELVRNEAAVRRFHREMQAAARLNHRNIVTAHDAEQAGGLHFLVMEYAMA